MIAFTNIILAIGVFTLLYYLAKWVNSIINNYDSELKKKKKDVYK